MTPPLVTAFVPPAIVRAAIEAEHRAAEFRQVEEATRKAIEQPNKLAVLRDREQRRPMNRQEARDARRARRRRGKGWTR